MATAYTSTPHASANVVEVAPGEAHGFVTPAAITVTTVSTSVRQASANTSSLGKGRPRSVARNPLSVKFIVGDDKYQRGEFIECHIVGCEATIPVLHQAAIPKREKVFKDCYSYSIQQHLSVLHPEQLASNPLHLTNEAWQQVDRGLKHRCPPSLEIPPLVHAPSDPLLSDGEEENSQLDFNKSKATLEVKDDSFVECIGGVDVTTSNIAEMLEQQAKRINTQGWTIDECAPNGSCAIIGIGKGLGLIEIGLVTNERVIKSLRKLAHDILESHPTLNLDTSTAGRNVVGMNEYAGRSVFAALSFHSQRPIAVIPIGLGRVHIYNGETEEFMEWTKFVAWVRCHRQESRAKPIVLQYNASTLDLKRGNHYNHVVIPHYYYDSDPDSGVEGNDSDDEEDVGDLSDSNDEGVHDSVTSREGTDLVGDSTDCSDSENGSDGYWNVAKRNVKGFALRRRGVSTIEPPSTRPVGRPKGGKTGGKRRQSNGGTFLPNSDDAWKRNCKSAQHLLKKREARNVTTKSFVSREKFNSVRKLSLERRRIIQQQHRHIKKLEKSAQAGQKGVNILNVRKGRNRVRNHLNIRGQIMGVELKQIGNVGARKVRDIGNYLAENMADAPFNFHLGAKDAIYIAENIVDMLKFSIEGKMLKEHIIRGGKFWIIVDTSPLSSHGHVLGFTVGWAESKSRTQEGQFTCSTTHHIVFLPLTTVADSKSGEEVAGAITKLLLNWDISKEDVLKAAWVLTADGGGENNGNVREKGCFRSSFRGENGLFAKLFGDGATFWWCGCHIGNLHLRESTSDYVLAFFRSASKVVRGRGYLTKLKSLMDMIISNDLRKCSPEMTMAMKKYENFGCSKWNENLPKSIATLGCETRWVSEVKAALWLSPYLGRDPNIVLPSFCEARDGGIRKDKAFLLSRRTDDDVDRISSTQFLRAFDSLGSYVFSREAFSQLQFHEPELLHVDQDGDLNVVRRALKDENLEWNQAWEKGGFHPPLRLNQTTLSEEEISDSDIMDERDSFMWAELATRRVREGLLPFTIALHAINGQVTKWTKEWAEKNNTKRAWRVAFILNNPILKFQLEVILSQYSYIWEPMFKVFFTHEGRFTPKVVGARGAYNDWVTTCDTMVSDAGVVNWEFFRTSIPYIRDAEAYSLEGNQSFKVRTYVINVVKVMKRSLISRFSHFGRIEYKINAMADEVTMHKEGEEHLVPSSNAITTMRECVNMWDSMTVLDQECASDTVRSIFDGGRTETMLRKFVTRVEADLENDSSWFSLEERYSRSLRTPGTFELWKRLQALAGISGSSTMVEQYFSVLLRWIARAPNASLRNVSLNARAKRNKVRIPKDVSGAVWKKAQKLVRKMEKDGVYECDVDTALMKHWEKNESKLVGVQDAELTVTLGTQWVTSLFDSHGGRKQKSTVKSTSIQLGDVGESSDSDYCGSSDASHRSIDIDHGGEVNDGGNNPFASSEEEGVSNEEVVVSEAVVNDAIVGSIHSTLVDRDPPLIDSHRIGSYWVEVFDADDSKGFKFWLYKVVATRQEHSRGEVQDIMIVQHFEEMRRKMLLTTATFGHIGLDKYLPCTRNGAHCAGCSTLTGSLPYEIRVQSSVDDRLNGEGPQLYPVRVDARDDWFEMVSRVSDMHERRKVQLELERDIERDNGEHVCALCEKETGAKLVECDGCKRGMHETCALIRGATHLPSGVFLCEECGLDYNRVERTRRGNVKRT